MNLISIQVGKPRVQADPGREWRTGFFKAPIEGEVIISRLGLEGDGQADLDNHGGPDKAICVYPREHLDAWESELDLVMMNGAFGENFTAAAVDEATVCIGDIYQCGELAVQVSQPRQPCWKLSQRWKIKTLAAQTIKSGRTGWYFRVLEQARLAAPAEFVLAERPNPEWTVERANHVMYFEKKNEQSARELSSLPELSESWQKTLQSRVA